MLWLPSSFESTINCRFGNLIRSIRRRVDNNWATFTLLIVFDAKRYIKSTIDKIIVVEKGGRITVAIIFLGCSIVLGL